MQWTEEGLILSVRRHGESSAIVSLLTVGHGRHAELVRGGGGSRRRGIPQPGTLVLATWRARLADHLGAFALEGMGSGLGAILDDRGRLAALAAAAAVADAALPERHPYPRLFAAFERLLGVLASERDWGEAFVRWEITLLDELGFGLDLGSCALTGAREGLAYVSPKSGRAVAAGAAGPYRDRLLPLPRFLVEDAVADPEAVSQGLRLTGSFLERFAFVPQGRKLPAARHRLLGMIPVATTNPGAIRSAEGS